VVSRLLVLPTGQSSFKLGKVKKREIKPLTKNLMRSLKPKSWIEKSGRKKQKAFFL